MSRMAEFRPQILGSLDRMAGTAAIRHWEGFQMVRVAIRRFPNSLVTPATSSPQERIFDAQMCKLVFGTAASAAMAGMFDKEGKIHNITMGNKFPQGFASDAWIQHHLDPTVQHITIAERLKEKYHLSPEAITLSNEIYEYCIPRVDDLLSTEFPEYGANLANVKRWEERIHRSSAGRQRKPL